MGLRITLLGTGGSGGVPLIGGADGRGNWGLCDPLVPENCRSRSSIFIEHTDSAGKLTRILVDASPDLRAQALRHGVAGIDAVIFTHAHADHILGIDELRVFNRIAGRALPVFANAATLAEMGRRFDYAFRAPTPPAFFRPALIGHDVVGGDRFSVEGIDITSLDMDHQVMRVLGIRMGSFAYTTDVVRLSDGDIAALQGLDCWVLGCFQLSPHMTHAHLDLALAWYRLVRPKRLILTHMGPDMDYAALRAKMPAGVEIGFDGLQFSLV
jgi:phosphoribosyl 1,2-cyclic phosphate phosphodiesterase